MRREKPIDKQPELGQLLKSLKIGRYHDRHSAPARSAYSSHGQEFNELAEDGTLRFQEFGDNVVQLFPDDNFSQVPPGW